jgi:hypothetical protein
MPILAHACLACIAALPVEPRLAQSQGGDPAPASAPAAGGLSQAGLEQVAKEIQAEVEALRGLAFKAPVRVKLAGQAEFLDYARRRQKETEGEGRLRRDESIAKLLGLVPGEMDLERTLMAILEKQVGGFYDPKEDAFYLMGGFNGGVAKIILAHELAHALDDQHYDLDAGTKRCGEDSDRELAWRSVVEGSGTAAMNQWFLKHRKEVDPADLAKAQSLGGPELAAAPGWLWKPLVASYLRGEGFLVRQGGLNLLMAKPKAADLDQALKTPPVSTEQILHPEKYWDPAKRDDPRMVELDLANLPAGWKRVAEDTYGELLLALLATPREKRKGLDVSNPANVLAIEYTNEAAAGWDGDRIVLLERDGAMAILCATTWDTPTDADQFAAAARANLAADASEKGLAPRAVLVERRGEADVVLVAASVALSVDELRALEPRYRLR